MAQPGSLNKDLIYLKVDDAYTVWFKASKNFLLLEEPAFYVLDLIVKGLTRDKISREFSHKFGYPIHEVDVFVDDISNKFAGFLIPKPGKNQELNKTHNYNIDSIKFLSEKTYLLGNKKASIKYGDKELESVIHPLINHFILSDSGSPNLHYYFYRQEGKLIFQIDKKVVEQFENNESGYLKAAFLLRLLSLLHDVEPEKWMITLHASAISDGKNALLFSASAGSGKSTLAALLHANGYKMLSDDFLAMNGAKQLVYHLPVATTIKKGSIKVLLPHFPELEKQTLEKAYTGKEVRYIPISTKIDLGVGYPVKKLVFVNYSPEKKFSFQQIKKKKAIKILLEETWINPKPKHVTDFFKWFDQSDFFEMEYSDVSDALKAVKELFET